MKKNQIFKQKTTFDQVMPKLAVAFGFIAIILTTFWFLMSSFCGDGLLYRLRHIQTISLIFYVPVAGLLIARAIINIRNRKFVSSTIFNMVCGIIILIFSIICMTMFNVIPKEDDFIKVQRIIIKYGVISLTCVLWAISFNLLQMKNGLVQDHVFVKKNNAILLLVLGLLMLPIYILLFVSTMFVESLIDDTESYRTIIRVMLLLIPIIMCSQLILNCVTENQNKRPQTILLAVCMSFIFASYAIVKSWRGDLLFGRSLEYIYLLCSLTTTILTIPVFVKTRN